jgi:electron transfer flavoprotein alpha subunit
MILVVAEQRAGMLNRASWEAVAAAQQMGGPVKVALPGVGLGPVSAELAAADVAEVIALESLALAEYTADGYVQAIAAFIEAESPDHVLFAHTYQTRDFAPRLAARLDRAIVTDCVAVKPGDDRGDSSARGSREDSESASAGAATRGGGAPRALMFVRPMFQGKVHADVVLEGPAPHFVSFQIGAFRPDAVRKGSAAAPIRTVPASVDPSKIRQKPEAPFREARQAVDLSQAERIVAVGRGIKGQEHLAVAQALAQALDAELAASRPICDAGWLPMERQIGSSGQTVAPKLYVALGISGAIQHVVGMKGARTIVAINKDPEAPIFELADYGITGDLFDVVPAIVKVLQQS